MATPGLGDGEEVGLGDGEMAGLGDGVVAGLGDGEVAGLGDGEVAGLGDGEEVGLGDGEEVGLGDGEEVGLGDGEEVGLGDGEEVGLGDGEEVGLGDGEEVGLRRWSRGRPGRNNVLPSMKFGCGATDLVQVLLAALPPAGNIRRARFFGRSREDQVADLDVAHWPVVACGPGVDLLADARRGLSNLIGWPEVSNDRRIDSPIVNHGCIVADRRR